MDPLPLYKGLLGPIIIRDPGKPQPDKEFFTAFHSFQPAATGLDQPFYCINGRAYAGNTPTCEPTSATTSPSTSTRSTTTSTPSTSTATAGPTTTARSSTT